jgi:photosystem II stability/assembly factor-like uncharacterized protein
MKKTLLLVALLATTITARTQNYWQKLAVGTQKDLLSVSFGSKSTGYIAGRDSLLLKTTDGGLTWNKVNYSGLGFSNAARDIIHVNFIHPDTGFAIVSNFANPTYLGALFQTVNGGINWTNVNAGNITAYHTWMRDSRNSMVVGSAFFAGQTMAQSTNGNWSNYQSFAWLPEDFLYTVDCRGSVCITAGSGGLVYRSLNNGATWDTVKTVTDSAIRSVKFADERTLIAATDDPMGGVMVSLDTGRTWQFENSVLTFFYPKMRSVTISKTDSFIVVGKVNWDTTGVIIWGNATSGNALGTEQQMNCVTMRDDSVAFAVGNRGLVMHNKTLQVDVADVDRGRMNALVFPNPSQGKFTITSDAAFTWKVLDIRGSLLQEGASHGATAAVDLSRQASGVYILSIRSGERQSHVRLAVY